MLALLFVFGVLVPVRAAARGVYATTYQINPAHTGFTSTTLRPPLRWAWSTVLGTDVSYALIAQGSVFVVSTGRVPELYALSPRTGRVRWARAVTRAVGAVVASPAYDDGRVFVAATHTVGDVAYAELDAYRASDGRLLWRNRRIGQPSVDAPIVASQGMVYLASSGVGVTLYAVRERNGRMLWQRLMEAGDNSAPTLSATRVFLSYPCQTWSIRRSNGSVAWALLRGCDGGGGTTAVLNGGRLFVRDVGTNDSGQGDDGIVVSATRGRLLGRFATGIRNDPPPAFAGPVGLFVHQGLLTARSGGRVLWGFRGDGALTTAPIITGSIAYIGSATGNVFALALRTGRLLWSASAGAPIGPSTPVGNNVFAGLAADASHLYVAATNHLTAFRTR